ncbi:MAG: Ldh family oxidoreductase, partial [Pseudomonadota bacterium]|nr:Ldh family oxidoreductase [Pseudomonadota bacterium]
IFILIDPKGFHETFSDRVEALFGKILAQEGTRIPGDRRYANRARSATDGIECQAALHQQILDMRGG